MALHADLPIYRTGVQLLTLAIKVQEQMPRGVKRELGPPPTGFAGPSRGHRQRPGKAGSAARARGHCVNGQLTKAYPT